MLARFLQLLLLVGALPALALLSVALWFGVAHLRYLRFHRQRGITPPSLGLAGGVRYYAGVLVAVSRAAWWQLRGLGRGGLRRPVGSETGPPVLCVHGFLMNDTVFWGLRQRLRVGGRASRAVFLGWAHRPLADYGPALERALEEMLAEPQEEPVDVVAHSMGGIVLRWVLSRRPDLGGRVRRIVTLGSPHRGTSVSRSLPVGPEVLEMGIGSSFLAELPDFRSAAPAARVTTVAARPDLVVYPQGNAHLPGCRQVDLTCVSHLGLITERAGIEAVLDALGVDGDDRGEGGRS